MGRKRKEEDVSDEDIDFEDIDGEEPLEQTVDSGQEVDDLEVEETNDEITDAKAEQKVLFPETSVLSQIKNKLRRREMYVKLKKQKKEAKKESRTERQNMAKAMGEKAIKQVPKTIESMREPDETMVDPEDEEVKIDESLDEMSAYFRKDV
ncbi:unnamed protein product, partial [Oppiella nova]